MDHPLVFTADLAAIYDDTRIADPQECWSQLSRAFEMVHARGRKRLLDVGCGTGRLLACVPEQIRQRWDITGLDCSQAMLDVARRKPLSNVTFRCTTLAEFAGDTTAQHSFDLILCHWFFHCVADWHTALYDVVRLAKPRGIIAWLDEDSTLYRALDQIAAEKGMSDPVLHALFQLYYEAAVKSARAHSTTLLSPVRRCGTRLRNTSDLVQCFRTLGWSVQPAYEGLQPSKWTRSATVGWIVDKVLQPRAFTNLRRIPCNIHDAAMKELRSRIGRAGAPQLNKNVSLEYSARLQYAKQSDYQGPEGAAGNVKGAAELLRPYTLSVEISNRGVHTGITLRPITSFFASLLADRVSSEWDGFWMRDVPSGGRKAVRPLWGWVRLARSGEERIETFARSVIFSFAAEPAAFSENKLKAYFSSCIPFVTLAETTAFYFQPVIVRFPDAQGTSEFRVAPQHESKGLELAVPHKFMRAYVPSVFEFGDDSRNVIAWKKACDGFKKSLCGVRDTGRAVERARQDLRNAGRLLDDALGIQLFSGRHGMGNFYDLLRGFALFPGRVFCLFAVPGVNRRIGGSLTLAFDDELSELQVMTLKDVVEVLLLVPGVLSTAGRSTG